MGGRRAPYLLVLSGAYVSESSSARHVPPAWSSEPDARVAAAAATAENRQRPAGGRSKWQQRGLIAKDAAEQGRAQAAAPAALVKADKANVESARAQLVAGDAAVDTARVQLSYTSIASPIDGRTGTLSVKAGNLVTANNTELMTIAQVQPVL